MNNFKPLQFKTILIKNMQDVNVKFILSSITEKALCFYKNADFFFASNSFTWWYRTEYSWVNKLLRFLMKSRTLCIPS